MKHLGIEIEFFNLDTFKKQNDVTVIDLDSELVDLNYKVASLIFCHFWRSIFLKGAMQNHCVGSLDMSISRDLRQARLKA